MKKNVLHDKNIVLGVCGGIAAYKSVELLRRLVKLGRAGAGNHDPKCRPVRGAP
jgi:hypothetical protein